MTHVCPCGCDEMIDSERFCCRKSWFSLPRELRSRIWREYKTAKGSIAHLRVLGEARQWLRGSS